MRRTIITGSWGTQEHLPLIWVEWPTQAGRGLTRRKIAAELIQLRRSQANGSGAIIQAFGLEAAAGNILPTLQHQRQPQTLQLRTMGIAYTQTPETYLAAKVIGCIHRKVVAETSGNQPPFRSRPPEADPLHAGWRR